MSLFVGNLYINIKESELKEVFGKFGRCQVDLKKKYAFIDFDDPEGAKQAILNLHNTNLDGYSDRKCNIEWSNKKDKPPQASGTPRDQQQSK